MGALSQKLLLRSARQLAIQRSKSAGRVLCGAPLQSRQPAGQVVPGAVPPWRRTAAATAAAKFYWLVLQLMILHRRPQLRQ